MATVNLIDIAKRVGSLTILDQVNLSINKGEFIVVVGPSGCGKSTLLRLIAGLDSLSSGQILINDTCVNRIPPAKRDMAMVFQNYALYPHMTVFDNMAYGLKMRGYKKEVIQKKVTDAAHLLQLTPYLERKPQALSGGQKQRVAMGRAIVRSPAVYLFDEPLSNLDAKLRTEMRHEIKKLHQEFNTTSLYVTHDQTEAMTMAERIVVLNQGRVEQIGRPQQLYQNPGSIFVAGFTGHYPINFFKGHLDKVANLIHTGVGNFKAPKCTHLLEHNTAVVLAIRPEHLQLCSENTEGALAITVDFVDDMGADRLIQARSMGNSSELLNVRVQSDVGMVNQTFYVSFPREKLHLFDEQTGQRIGDWCE